jgi:hypothetical protein
MLIKALNLFVAICLIVLANELRKQRTYWLAVIDFLLAVVNILAFVGGL